MAKKFAFPELIGKDKLIGYYAEAEDLKDAKKRSEDIQYDIKEFPLRKVSVPELAQLRNSKKPGFVLKEKSSYFYTEIPNEFRFTGTNSLFQHLCAQHCDHLSAAPIENGGCPKIRNNSKFIELYPWITYGFETFNTEQDAFIVATCLHYEKIPEVKK